MSQGYIHACERAELLGLPAPTEEEWKETQRSEAENRANDEDEDIALQDLDSAAESAQRIGGGLDELNSILNATQKKINRFKTVCGSLGTLLKVRVGSRNNTPDHKPRDQSSLKDTNESMSANDETLSLSCDGKNSESTNNDEEARRLTENNQEELDDETTLSCDMKTAKSTKDDTTKSKNISINEKMGSHLDKLDSLISKAENAQYSMKHQNKQMKKFLK